MKIQVQHFLIPVTGIKKTFCFRMIPVLLFFTLMYFMGGILPARAQGIIPTKGKDFWVGFPYHPNWGSSGGTKRCDLFITSDVNTSGIIIIPQQGWTQAFNVTANVTTTITLPLVNVEHNTSEIVEGRGLQILSNDTVSVFAITFQQYTADGTVVYPKQTLGTEYRISSYHGINVSNPPNITSNFLVVATEDNTQISITPTAATVGGHAANVPFNVSLNTGQSYQVMAAANAADLTGSTIKATDSSGSCRPFAVFSGSACVNIPTGCGACDILYDQALPVPYWGTTYYAAPFSFATKYTLRILADQNATGYTINGGAPTFLQAGQYTEINNITGSSCIVANKPIAVIQYMQGIACANAGDPAMMYLNSADQKIDQVTFSTVTSTVINQHNVNVIMNTAHTNQLSLDGAPVPASAFTPMAICTNMSYAQLNLTQGSHVLAADSGFSAYVYGTGSAESYAYSVGSFSKRQPLPVDSILCTNDTLTIGTTTTIYNVWWSTQTNPNDTIGTGLTLTLYPPIVPDIYIQHGTEFISGCDKTFLFEVSVPDPPVTFINTTANIACQNQQVQLTAGTIPASSSYQFSWTPITGLSNPNIPNPVATVTTSQWYVVAVSDPNGCANTVYDSVFVDVLPLPLPSASAGGNQTLCAGDSVTLTASGGASYLWNPGGIPNSTITVSPLVTTNYVVFVTDTNGCGNSDTVTVTVNQLPAANAGNNQTICASGSVNLSASGGVSYLWTPGGMSTANVSVSPTVTTTYSVEVTNTAGCTATDTVTVFVQPLPPANAGADQTVCIGASATLTASGGTSYLWAPGGSTSSTITVTPPTTTNYIVIVTDANGCVNRDTVRVNVNPIPTANAGANQSICIGNSATLTATGGVTYTWNPGGLNTSSITVSPVVTTNYIVQVADNIGCTDTDTVTVTVNPLPVADAGTTTAICIGGTATLTASGGGNYLWSPGGSASASINVSPVTSSYYTVQVTDINGCTDTDSVLVTVNPLPAASAGVDKAICPGGTTTLNASGGTSYLWQPGGSITASLSVSPATTTSYVVFVTDANGCINSDTAQVTVMPLPVANAGANQAICVGGSATLTATGGINYAWTPGGGSTSSITVSPVTTTSYVVLVSDANGCQNRDTVLVTVNPLPVADAGTAQTICAGDVASLTASGGTSYAWSPGGGSTASINVSPGTSTYFVVQVTDNNGCQDTDSVLVTVNPLPPANAGIDKEICPGGTTTLTATGGTSYLWTPGGNITGTISVSPAVTTNYIVLVTDANGCQQTDTAQVVVNPLPPANAGTDQAICIGASATLTATGGTSYVWTPGGNGSSITVTPIVSTWYNVLVTDANGCQKNDSVFVTVNPLPVVDAGADATICDGDVTTLTGSPTGVTYLWTPGNGSSATINVSPSTTTTYTLLVTDANGCQDSDNVTINVNPLPVASAGTDDLICPGSSTTLTATGGVSYAWSPNGATTQTTVVTPAAPTNYIVLVTDANGCQQTDTVFVNLQPLPVAEFILSAPSCEFRTLSFSSTSTVTLGTIDNYEWSFGDGGISALEHPTHSYAGAANYPVTLVITTNVGCMDTVMHTITVNPNPAADFTTTDVCAMDPSQFHDLSTIATGSVVQWLWEFGDGRTSVLQHPEYTYEYEGLYSVTLTAISDSGCSDSKTINPAVEIYPLPIASFFTTPPIVTIMDPVVNFIDQSAGGITWLWDFGDGAGATSTIQNPTHVYSDTGVYQISLIVTSNRGCLDTTFGEVYVEPYFTLYIPNAFTPNGDGRNDHFIPSGVSITAFEMLIFDRWGKVVYQSDTPARPWNGTVQDTGLECNQGVYVYVVKVADHRKVEHEYTGQVTLIR